MFECQINNGNLSVYFTSSGNVNNLTGASVKEMFTYKRQKKKDNIVSIRGRAAIFFRHRCAAFQAGFTDVYSESSK